MRILQSQSRSPLDLLAVGAGGRVAAGCATIGVPGHIDVWEVMTGAVRHRPLVSAREIRALAFTADGQFLLVGETTKTVTFDVTAAGTPRPVSGPERTLDYPEFALSADGRRLALTEANVHATRLTWFEVGEPPTDREPWPMFRQIWTNDTFGGAWFRLPAVSADGGWVAVVRRGNVRNGEQIELRDTTASDRVRVTLPGTALAPTRQLAFSADGAKLCVRTSSPVVRLYDAASGEAAGELAHPGTAVVTGMAVRSGDGRIMTCRADGTVWLWDAALRPITTLDWKQGPLVSVALAPDGSVGAAGTEDGQVVVWDVD